MVTFSGLVLGVLACLESFLCCKLLCCGLCGERRRKPPSPPASPYNSTTSHVRPNTSLTSPSIQTATHPSPPPPPFNSTTSHVRSKTSLASPLIQTATHHSPPANSTSHVPPKTLLTSPLIQTTTHPSPPLSHKCYHAYTTVSLPSPSNVFPTEPPNLQQAREVVSSSSSSSSSFKRSTDTCLPVFKIPGQLKQLIEEDVVPKILSDGLSPSNYTNYFACLLYAEDVYCEKWDGNYLLHQVTLELCERSDDVHRGEQHQQQKQKKNEHSGKKRGVVSFVIGSVPMERPYLISRDFVFLQQLDARSKPFQGSFIRMQNRNTVVAEFEEDFHSQHSATKKYDVSFSFNRVCLKRAHNAVSAAMGPVLLQNLLFPTLISTRKYFRTKVSYPLGKKEKAVASQIVNLKTPTLYLIEGPISENYGSISITGVIIQETILEIYRNFANSRVLVCAPRNRTCDVLLRGLSKHIPDSEVFRANAAFREYDDVPEDILKASAYKSERECFVCPPFAVLSKFKVISSTFMSSFRVKNQGIRPGHFSHIFLVDASSVAEPEAVVPLANLVDQNTVVVISGSLQNHPRHVRSPFARKNGLQTSFFERLLHSDHYWEHVPYEC